MICFIANFNWLTGHLTALSGVSQIIHSLSVCLGKTTEQQCLQCSYLPRHHRQFVNYPWLHACRALDTLGFCRKVARVIGFELLAVLFVFSLGCLGTCCSSCEHARRFWADTRPKSISCWYNRMLSLTSMLSWEKKIDFGWMFRCF